MVWLLAFAAGVVLAYFVPETSFSVEIKFLFVGIWGAVLGFIFYTIAKKAVQDGEGGDDYPSAQNHITELVPIVPGEVPEEPGETAPEETAEGVAEEAAASVEESPAAPLPKPLFPLEEWSEFCREVLRNRPFSEVVAMLGRSPLHVRGCPVRDAQDFLLWRLRH